MAHQKLTSINEKVMIAIVAISSIFASGWIRQEDRQEAVLFGRQEIGLSHWEGCNSCP